MGGRKGWEAGIVGRHDMKKGVVGGKGEIREEGRGKVHKRRRKK